MNAPPTRERRPGRGGADSEDVQAGSPNSSTIRPQPDGPRARDAFLAGFDCGEHVGRTLGELDGWRAGYAAGRADGRAEALAEVDERQATRDDALVRSIAATAARGVPFADLCDRRGQHNRADAQRRALRERGVA